MNLHQGEQHALIYANLFILVYKLNILYIFESIQILDYKVGKWAFCTQVELINISVLAKYRKSAKIGTLFLNWNTDRCLHKSLKLLDIDQWTLYMSS